MRGTVLVADYDRGMRQLVAAVLAATTAAAVWERRRAGRPAHAEVVTAPAL